MAIRATSNLSEMFNVARLEKEFGAAAMEVADDVRDAIPAEMRSSRPRGRTYKRGGRVHQASAPGQPPAIDKGQLVNSFRSRKTGKTSAEIYSTDEPKAAGLEYGTSTTAPRPVAEPTLEKKREDLFNKAQAIINSLNK